MREIQTQFLHYFSKSDNKSNHHQLISVQAETKTHKLVLVGELSEIWGLLEHEQEKKNNLAYFQN